MLQGFFFPTVHRHCNMLSIYPPTQQHHSAQHRLTLQVCRKLPTLEKNLCESDCLFFFSPPPPFTSTQSFRSLSPSLTLYSHFPTSHFFQFQVSLFSLPWLLGWGFQSFSLWTNPVSQTASYPFVCSHCPLSSCSPLPVMSVSMRNPPQRRRSLGPVSPKRIYRNLSVRLRGGESSVAGEGEAPRHLSKSADAVRWFVGIWGGGLVSWAGIFSCPLAGFWSYFDSICLWRFMCPHCIYSLLSSTAALLPLPQEMNLSFDTNCLSPTSTHHLLNPHPLSLTPY